MSCNQNALLRFPHAKPIQRGNRTLVMGIVNLTPDSFSGGNQPIPTPREAADQALALLAAGADVIDFGAESTRPGAKPISAQEEIERLGDAIRLTRAATDAPLSIDTYHVETASHALGQGADIINDVSSLRLGWDDPAADNEAMAALIARHDAHVVLMHMPAPPERMQDDPQYDNVTSEVAAFLLDRALYAEQTGIERDRIWLDPGFGFAKTFAHNRELLLNLDKLASAGYPVLAGLSRKRMIFDALGLSAGERMEASLALAVIAAMKGAAMVRVHDVKETVRAVGMANAVG